jgi:phosphotransferase system  glucose/maltose/N-acetylglucosamine-specific IIC component
VDGFIQAIGSGIGGLVAGSFSVVGQTLGGIVDALNRSLPGGWLAAVVFVVLFVVAWQLIKR